MLYRKVVCSKETDVLYLADGEEKEIPKQFALAAKLTSIRPSGQVLAVVIMSVGVCQGLAYLYLVLSGPASARALRNLYK